MFYSPQPLGRQFLSLAIKQKCGGSDFIILKQMVHNGRQGGSEGVMGVEGGGRGGGEEEEEAP